MKQTVLTSISETPINTTENSSTSNNSFTGPYYKFAKFIVKTFSTKYKFNVEKPVTAKIYVCRHKNSHGVVNLLKSADFDLHPLALNVFTDFKSCFKHLFSYTFTKRYKIPKILAFIPAVISAMVISPLVKSAKAVPVYRNSVKSCLTLKNATAFLEKGESLIVFPDVDYNLVSGEVKSIYSGFLYIDKLYHKLTGIHVEFVPIKIDDKSKTITQLSSVSFNNDLPFDKQLDSVIDKLKNDIS